MEGWSREQWRKNQKWTKDEEENLMSMRREGADWEDISLILQRFSPHACRVRFYKILKRKRKTL